MSKRKMEERHDGSRKPGRGQATIEFALVLFFLLVPLLIGLADIARAFSEQLAVVHAANVGARWATLSPVQQACSGFGSLEDVIQSDLPSNLRDPSQHSVATSTPTVAGIQSVEVTIEYTHTMLFGVAPSVQFTGRSTMPGPVVSTSGSLSCPTYTPTPHTYGRTNDGNPNSTATPTRAATPTNTPHPLSRPLSRPNPLDTVAQKGACAPNRLRY